MMRKRCDFVEWVICMLLMTIGFSACSSIDDDRTDCGEEEEELQLDYELRLVTNMTTELQTQLTTITEVGVASSATLPTISTSHSMIPRAIKVFSTIRAT